MQADCGAGWRIMNRWSQIGEGSVESEAGRMTDGNIVKEN